MKLTTLTYLFLCLLSLNAFSASETGFALIKKSHGTVFKSAGGKTTIVKNGDSLQPEDEIFTEISATVNVLVDNKFMYYLTGGSRIKLKKNEINLMSGQLYVQSNSETKILLYTANGLVEFSKGEMILTYEPDRSKTQVLVISGMAKFGNKMERDYNVSIVNGQFSFLDNSEEYLYPRNPTNIGNSSFVKMKTAFHNINNLESLDHYRMEELTASNPVDDFNAKIEKAISSNVVDDSPHVTRGIASVRIKPIAKKIAPAIVTKKVQKQKVVARVFGMSGTMEAPSVRAVVRGPAEVKKTLEEDSDESTVHSSAYKQEADRLMEELSNYRSEVQK